MPSLEPHRFARTLTTLGLSLTLALGAFACSDSSDDDSAMNDDDSYMAQRNDDGDAHQRAIDAIRNGQDQGPNGNQSQYQQQQGYNNQGNNNANGQYQQNGQFPQNNQYQRNGQYPQNNAGYQNNQNTQTYPNQQGNQNNQQGYQNNQNQRSNQNQQANQNQQPNQYQQNANNGNAQAQGQAQGQRPPVQPVSNDPRFTAFREHKLVDPGMNNAHSHTLLVPEGWQVEGGLIRPNIKLYNMPTLIDLKVTAPDGRRARIMPAMCFEFNNQAPAQPGSPTNSGNIYLPLPESAGKWILQMAQSQPDPSISDLTLVSEKMEETLTAQLRKQAQTFYQQTAQFNQTAAGIGMGAFYDTQAQVITFTYKQNGQPFEETFLVCWYVNLTSIQGQLSSGMWGTTLMISVRDAPGKDPSKDPQLQAIFQSFHPTPAWQNEMNKYWQGLANIRAKGAKTDRENLASHNEFMRKNNEEINNIIVGGYKNVDAMRERGHRNTIDTIQEVTPYQTPSGEVVRLPSHYNNAYTDGNGRYLLNNDSNFNPNVDPNFNNRNWQTVEQARPGAQ